jgi:hypothetical protein
MRILDVEEVEGGEGSLVTGQLVEGETVHAAFRSPTASVLFTDRRILLVEQSALLDVRVETSSFSYRAMRQFSLLEAGSDRRAAIRIWLGGDPQPLHLRGNPGTDMARLQRLLAEKLG